MKISHPLRALVLFTALFFASITVLKAQVFVRAFNFRPTGEMGFVLKPAVSVDIGYSKAFDEGRFRPNISLTFLKMSPRLDTFPVVTVQSGGNGTIILPGKQSFSKYNLILLDFGFDYAFYSTDKFAAYGGFDLMAGTASVAYYETVPTYKTESYSGGGVLIGLRFRAGVDYYINDTWSLLATANRQGMLVAEPAGLYGANDYGIGLRYSFQ